MTEDLNDLLNKLSLNDLHKLAKRNRINIPQSWSKQLIVELLSLNVPLQSIQGIQTISIDPRKVTENSAIIIQNLVKQFDEITAVDGLNLEIQQGELFSLLGPNGAGKTTTINILNGIIAPTKGTALVGGFDIDSHLNEIKNLIGVCPQQAAVFEFLTGRENIELFGHLHAIPKKTIHERMEHLLNVLELTEASDRKAKGYSGGMLRKLNLIIALISNPQIAFLDEPTVGMDPRARRATWDFIASLKNQNKTIILTTHYIEEAETLSDRVGIIDYGKLIALGSPHELMEKHNAENLEDVFLQLTGRRILEGV
ncbi:MAG: ATP-binding cassette domain-containing protein [Candidatus Bathyarchaeota archaeon]|nr:ATP-binding cassette domain-containing protein [Candidatus Bathyarchaeota archaeon]